MPFIATIPGIIGTGYEAAVYPYPPTTWTILAGFTPIADSVTPDGWDVSWHDAPNSANITAPHGSAGTYKVYLEYGGQGYSAVFSVVCMAVTIEDLGATTDDDGATYTAHPTVSILGGTPDFTYSWSLVDEFGDPYMGSDASISGETTSAPTVTFDSEGAVGSVYIQVTVGDDDGCSAFDGPRGFEAIAPAPSQCPVLSPLSLTPLDSVPYDGLTRKIYFQVDATGSIPEQASYAGFTPSWVVSAGVFIDGTPAFNLVDTGSGATYTASMTCFYFGTHSDLSKTATFHLAGESGIGEDCDTTRSIALTYSCAVRTASIEATLVVPSEGDGSAKYNLVAILENGDTVVTGDFKYVWATALEATFDSGGTLTDSTATITIPKGAGDVVSLRIQTPTGPCEYTATLTLTASGATTPGEGDSCTIASAMVVDDLGGGDYKVSAQLTFAQTDTPTVTFIREGAVVPTSAPYSITIHLNGGESAEIMAVVQDGTCFRTETIVVRNDDGPFLENPSGGDDDCVSRVGTYYRDFIAPSLPAGVEYYKAHFGVENLALCPNPACNYWVQMYYSTDVALCQVYTDEATRKHKPLSPIKGASYAASGTRIARTQYESHATLVPAGPHLHMRLKASPVFDLWPLTTGCETIVKIRDNDDGTAMVFGTGPAKVFRYTPPRETAIGDARAGTLDLLIDLSTLTPDASDATDVALAGDKIYVTRPDEVFVYDTDSGQLSLAGGIRGAGAATFLENLNGKMLAIYVSDGSTCYDISFSPPKQLWTSEASFTLCQVADDKLLLAADGTLYISATGAETPVLQPFSGDDDEFPDTITALATNYVGTDSGHIYCNLVTGWTDGVTLAGHVGAVWPWYGGLQELRGLAGALSGTGADTLKAESPDLSWKDDRTLEGSVSGVSAMRALTSETIPATDTSPALIREFNLIGTTAAGILFVYYLSFLSEEDGAFKSCHTIGQRVIGIQRRANS